MDWLKFPPLSALRAFAAFAEAGTLSKAGKALNVSHAAISQQIRALEDHLGLALVSRETRQMQLTDAGHKLADTLTLSFSAMARTLEELTEADADRPVQVTATPVFAAKWLMPRLPDFQKQYPDIDLMLNPTTSLANPELGGIDIALRFGSGDWPGFDVELLVSTNLAVLASPSLVGDREFEDPSELLAYPWLQQLGTDEAEDWLRKHGVTDTYRRRSVRLPGDLMLDGALAGQGVIMMTLSSVEPEVASGRLRLLFRDDGETGYFAVTRPGVLRPAARKFQKWIREAAKSDRLKHDQHQ